MENDNVRMSGSLPADYVRGADEVCGRKAEKSLHRTPYGENSEKVKENVAVDVVKSELPIEEVLKEHGISEAEFEDWLVERSFQKQVELRVQAAKFRTALLLAKYAPLAMAKLVGLACSEKEETARKACLDIISLASTESVKNTQREMAEQVNEDEELVNLTEEQASKILGVLAED